MLHTICFLTIDAYAEAASHSGHRARLRFVRHARGARALHTVCPARTGNLRGGTAFHRGDGPKARSHHHRGLTLSRRQPARAGCRLLTGHRPRPAYRPTVENSVYVTQAAHRHGIGTALLTALVARCETGPWRQMVAGMGNSANRGSIALHRKAGFTE